ncbi:unnamed protein product [Polarella glacialis]|uniref:Uncharacterized protein n=1 Tax=Polarella glacialis TaxID=89957 RepID=A0A813LAX4_POLGL|nr:unnamed protein product [Polarella glacialis]
MAGNSSILATTNLHRESNIGTARQRVARAAADSNPRGPGCSCPAARPSSRCVGAVHWKSRSGPQWWLLQLHSLKPALCVHSKLSESLHVFWKLVHCTESEGLKEVNSGEDSPLLPGMATAVIAPIVMPACTLKSEI